ANLRGDRLHKVGRPLCSKQIRAQVIDGSHAPVVIGQKNVAVELYFLTALVRSVRGVLGYNHPKVLSKGVPLVSDGTIPGMLRPAFAAVQFATDLGIGAAVDGPIEAVAEDGSASIGYANDRDEETALASQIVNGMFGVREVKHRYVANAKR